MKYKLYNRFTDSFIDNDSYVCMPDGRCGFINTVGEFIEDVNVEAIEEK